MIDDLQDTIYEVQAELAEIVDELIADLMEPQIRRMVQMQFAMMGPDEKEIIRRQDPDNYARFEQYLNQ